MAELTYQGHRIGFEEYGKGERPIVLVHGLLMNRRMYRQLGPALAERGNRAICVDLLGHGASEQPEDLRLYSMPLFAAQVVALLDHLGLERAVVGGTSLGANVALELAVRHPDRAAGLFVEMPVLDNALAAVAAIFAPVLLGLRVGRPAFELSSRVASLLPRTNFLLDIGLDWARRRPGPSIAVLEGLLLGETAPPREQRREIAQPTLIVGHPRDPLHPFSDSGMLVEELRGARLVEADSILEWRIAPERLTGELALFLDEVWGSAQGRKAVGSAANGDGRHASAPLGG
jgi:pimeloyl-ACP methyl ester carboxylesterase